MPSADGKSSAKDGFAPRPPASLVIALVICTLLGAGLFWFFDEEAVTDRKLAYGCFDSSQAPSIRIDPSGLTLVGPGGTHIAPFDLEYVKGYNLKIDGSFELVRQGDQFAWEKTPRGWTYLFSFRGPEAFSGHPAHDPNQLNEFEVVAQDGHTVRYVRTSRIPCLSNVDMAT